MVLDEYGTMSLAEVLEPAIGLARDGIVVTADLADSLKGLEDRLKKWPASEAIFFKEGGAFYEPGDRLVQADLAATLQRIADQGTDFTRARRRRPSSMRCRPRAAGSRWRTWPATRR